jgi:hypothetical protein
MRPGGGWEATVAGSFPSASIRAVFTSPHRSPFRSLGGPPGGKTYYGKGTSGKQTSLQALESVFLHAERDMFD